MSDELTIKKERVLEAAEQCSDARRILKTVFPEAFEKTTKNITDELQIVLDHADCGGEPLARIDIYYRGERIGYVRSTGIVAEHGYEIKEPDYTLYFQIFKK